MEKNIAVIKGDGIGPEIVDEALKVLDAIAEQELPENINIIIADQYEEGPIIEV